VLGKLKCCVTPNRPKEDRQNVDFVYLAEVTKRISEPDKESSQVVWFNLDKLPNENDFAFDHYENIKLYLQYLKSPFSLPVIA